MPSGNLVQFKRRQAAAPARWHRAGRAGTRPVRRPRQRLATMPFLSTAILAAVALALFFMTDLRTGLGGGFTLCGRWNYRNCVIDGDTIRRHGVKIRLQDIDAPETHEPKCASEAALGARATRRLLALINAGPFTVVRSGGRDLDAYGHQIRTIERDGRSLGAMLVAEGLARRWDGARHSWCG